MNWARQNPNLVTDFASHLARKSQTSVEWHGECVLNELNMETPRNTYIKHRFCRATGWRNSCRFSCVSRSMPSRFHSRRSLASCSSGCCIQVDCMARLPYLQSAITILWPKNWPNKLHLHTLCLRVLKLHLPEKRRSSSLINVCISSSSLWNLRHHALLLPRSDSPARRSSQLLVKRLKS